LSGRGKICYNNKKIKSQGDALGIKINMGLFSKEMSYLGVDIGINNVKVVELKNENGRPKLVTYGFSDRIVGNEDTEFFDNIDAAVGMLRQVCKKARVKSNQVVAALPISAIFTSIINLPSLKKTDSKKEIDEAVKWEAKKVIPMSLEEMTLHYHPLPKSAKEQTDTDLSVNRFLLTAAPQVLVKKYLELFEKSNLKILSLETESFALVRSLVGNDKSPVMIVDMGEASTNISIIKQGVPILNRSIDTAGRSFTSVFAKKLNLDWLAAEQFKRDLTNLGQDRGLESLKELLAILVHEISYCFSLYEQENGYALEKIEKIILTGASALLPGLDSYLTKSLNIKVFVGDPWARVIYPEVLKPILDKIGPEMSIAVGLAMREIE